MQSSKMNEWLLTSLDFIVDGGYWNTHMTQEPPTVSLAQSTVLPACYSIMKAGLTHLSTVLECWRQTS